MQLILKNMESDTTFVTSSPKAVADILGTSRQYVQLWCNIEKLLKEQGLTLYLGDDIDPFKTSTVGTADRSKTFSELLDESPNKVTVSHRDIPDISDYNLL